MAEDYKTFAIDFGKRAAEMMRSGFSLSIKHTAKEDGSPVTETDLAINRLLIEEVKRNFPDHSVLAEEESYMQEDSKYVWVCDPIDGTIPFAHGLPMSTFLLALVENGEPIIGIVVDPFQNHFFVAEKGRGALLNNAPIKVSDRDTLTPSVVFSEYWQQAPYNMLPLIKELEAQDCHVPILKSIAYGSSSVAFGQAIGAISPGNNAWDVAAVKILVEEAGGKVTDFYGNKQRYDQKIKGCIISNGVMHDELVKIIHDKVLS